MVRNEYSYFRNCFVILPPAKASVRSHISSLRSARVEEAQELPPGFALRNPESITSVLPDGTGIAQDAPDFLG